jgi:hypothetical protein
MAHGPGAELVTAMGLVSLTGPCQPRVQRGLEGNGNEWLDYGSA